MNKLKWKKWSHFVTEWSLSRAWDEMVASLGRNERFLRKNISFSTSSTLGRFFGKWIAQIFGVSILELLGRNEVKLLRDIIYPHPWVPKQGGGGMGYASHNISNFLKNQVEICPITPEKRYLYTLYPLCWEWMGSPIPSSFGTPALHLVIFSPRMRI